MQNANLAAAHAAGAETDDVRSLATIVARTSPHTRIAEGETASFAVDVSAIQFFDPATGVTIRS